MSTLARFPTFRDVLGLQQEIDRAFRITRPVAATPSENFALWSPAVDVYEDQEGITLTAELPGLAVEDIDLRVENDTLTLKGERKLEREDKREGYRRVERSYGTFSRSFSLPDTVDTERIKAESKNGVLKVFLPRREETKPRQIQVKIDG